jgi:hypothetical protein
VQKDKNLCSVKETLHRMLKIKIRRHKQEVLLVKLAQQMLNTQTPNHQPHFLNFGFSLPNTNPKACRNSLQLLKDEWQLLNQEMDMLKHKPQNHDQGSNVPNLKTQLRHPETNVQHHKTNVQNPKSITQQVAPYLQFIEAHVQPIATIKQFITTGFPIRFHDMQVKAQGLRFDMQGLQFDAQGFRFANSFLQSFVSGLQTKVQGLRFDVQGLQFNAPGLRIKVPDLQQALHHLSKLILRMLLRKNVTNDGENNSPAPLNTFDLSVLDLQTLKKQFQFIPSIFLFRSYVKLMDDTVRPP